MPQQDVELNEVALGSSSSQSESSSSSSSSSSSNGGSGDSGKKKHSKLCLILCIVIPVVVVVVVVVVLVVLLTGNKTAKCTAEGSKLSCGGGELTPESFPSDMDLATTTLDLDTFGGSIADDAFDAFTNLASFSVSEDNKTYAEVEGALVTKDGKTVVRVPPGIVLTPAGVEIAAPSAESGSIIVKVNEGGSDGEGQGGSGGSDEGTTVDPGKILVSGFKEIKGHAFLGVAADEIELPKEITIKEGAFGFSTATLSFTGADAVSGTILGDGFKSTDATFASESEYKLKTDWNKSGAICPTTLTSSVHAVIDEGSLAAEFSAESSSTTQVVLKATVGGFNIMYKTKQDSISLGSVELTEGSEVNTNIYPYIPRTVKTETLFPVYVAKGSDSDITVMGTYMGTLADMKKDGYVLYEANKGVYYLYFLKEGMYYIKVNTEGAKAEYVATVSDEDVSGDSADETAPEASVVAFPYEEVLVDTSVVFAAYDLADKETKPTFASNGDDPIDGFEDTDVSCEDAAELNFKVKDDDDDDKHIVRACTYTAKAGKLDAKIGDTVAASVKGTAKSTQ